MLQSKPHSIGFVSFAALVIWATSATAHQLWVETNATGVAGQEQLVHVCWGHAGEKGTGESLQKQQDRLSARIMRPDGQVEQLELEIGSDSFTAKFTPRLPGYYLIGAERQSGILTREFHGIPVHTRIVMYGKSSVSVAGSDAGLGAGLGLDLEVVPVGDPDRLHPGDIVAATVLFKNKTIGGRNVVVSLNTLGTQSFPEDPAIHGLMWSVDCNADRKTGGVSFPLIVCGQHQFYVRYMDETPGRYEGDREVTTDFSRLRKGDTYERTLYVSTSTVAVADLRQGRHY